MLLDAYLRDYFVDTSTCAALAGITVQRLDALIAAEAIPAPTYRCNAGTIHSAAFGSIDTDSRVSGAFFRPECTRWVRIAADAAAGEERAAVVSTLAAELAAHLRTCGDDAHRVDAKVAALLPHFFNGTFGLCVADPSSGRGIVRKEVLQETLVALTGNGSDPAPHGITAGELLTLIDDYADSAMPFSPAEYARSSRKRLVEDLRPRVLSAHQATQEGAA
ncbi:DUF6058 family natural product biosynthesis protein [Stenotrophomonas rhizophila]|uniref:DUF6058 family natural product biosynthesis protein n=1 Tax=Stenotrophomonas rhizophila TaxID=216778 RepID=UPI00045698A0|nr:DUF6058 family natural product biosynthesis protein [Stenotrophomonas rhizophila]AHY58009.1 hypothetical protein DX03_04730 [Stenotrophomonas rhizophila]